MSILESEWVVVGEFFEVGLEGEQEGGRRFVGGEEFSGGLVEFEDEGGPQLKVLGCKLMQKIDGIECV